MDAGDHLSRKAVLEAGIRERREVRWLLAADPVTGRVSERAGFEREPATMGEYRTGWNPSLLKVRHPLDTAPDTVRRAISNYRCYLGTVPIPRPSTSKEPHAQCRLRSSPK